MSNDPTTRFGNAVSEVVSSAGESRRSRPRRVEAALFLLPTLFAASCSASDDRDTTAVAESSPTAEMTTRQDAGNSDSVVTFDDPGGAPDSARLAALVEAAAGVATEESFDIPDCPFGQQLAETATDVPGSGATQGRFGGFYVSGDSFTLGTSAKTVACIGEDLFVEVHVAKKPIVVAVAQEAILQRLAESDVSVPQPLLSGSAFTVTFTASEQGRTQAVWIYDRYMFEASFLLAQPDEQMVADWWSASLPTVVQ